MKVNNIAIKYNPYFKQHNDKQKLHNENKITKTELNYVEQSANEYSLPYKNIYEGNSNINFNTNAINLQNSGVSLASERLDDYDKLVSKFCRFLDIFGNLYNETLKVKDLNPNSKIFDIVKEDYPEFSKWLKKVEDRTVFTLKDGETNELVGMLIPKLEPKDEIDCNPKIDSNNVMKLCCMVIDPNYRSAKCGFYLMFEVLDLASENNVTDIYFTRYPKENDNVIKFFEQYGFEKYGKNSNGEDVYLRHIDNTPENFHYYSILESPKRYSDDAIKNFERNFVTNIKLNLSNSAHPEKCKLK